jgi:hypothetical protein
MLNIVARVTITCLFESLVFAVSISEKAMWTCSNTKANLSQI